MKNRINLLNYIFILKHTGKCLAALLPALFLTAFQPSVQAQSFLPNNQYTNYFWDPGIANATGPSDGSAYWDDAVTQNWLSNNITPVLWPATGTNMAWFGAGGPGPYFVTNQNGITVSGLTFSNANNYTISGGAMTFNTPSSDYYGIFSCGNSTNTISDNIISANGTAMTNGANSQLTFNGGWTMHNTALITGTHNIAFALQPSNCVIWLTGSPAGTQEPYVDSGTLNLESDTFNITNAVMVGERLDVGGGNGNTMAIVNVYSNGQLDANGGAVNYNGNNSGNNFQISRSGASGIVNVYPGGIASSEIYSAAAANSDSGGGDMLIVGSDSAAWQSGELNVLGGTVLVGDGPNTFGSAGVNSVSLLNLIFYGSSSATATLNSHTNYAILNLSSGSVTAYDIKFDVPGNMSTYNPTNGINVTGGALYLAGPNFYTAGAWSALGTNFFCDLSGGTVSAIANWTPSAVPVNLTGINGNVTFQTTDANGVTPYSMAFSGPITGVGGFSLTGPGILTLSGAINYSGSTVLSNGELAVSTANAPVCGPVTLEGINDVSGYPTDSVHQTASGQKLTVNGSLTYDTGTPTADFNFSSFIPSTTIPAIQVNGNLVFNTTPNVSVEGSQIPVGTYPLISYTGSLTTVAPVPTSVTLSNIYSGYITNITASQTIALVITNSPVTIPIAWAVGNGNWDDATKNWVFLGTVNQTIYADADGVVFNDSASGPFPITVAVTPSFVYPTNITVSATNSYTINGPGVIAGTESLSKANTGSLTLTGANTYSGGTAVSGGTLYINNGGSSAANSAIGTGALTISGGALGNASGQAVTLLPSMPMTWSGSWSFVGTTNLNLGSGAVALDSAVALTVVTNTLEVDGQISDGAANYKITKMGAGTLILNGNNNFGSAIGAGLDVTAGQVDLNNAGAEGGGPLSLANCSFDNTSGSPIALSPAPSAISLANCTFIGSASLDLGNGPISAGGTTITVSNSVLYVEGPFAGASSMTTINGPGTFVVQGTVTQGSVTFNFANDVTFICNVTSGHAINTQGANLTTGSSIVVSNNPSAYGIQFNAPAITWNGGLLELNGDTGETLGSAATGCTMNGGVLSDNGASATVNLSFLTLGAGNDVINVTNGSTLTINGNITGTATNAVLIMTGGGEVIVATNTYAGNTAVSNGVLSLTYPALSTNSTVTIAVGATLDLNFTNSGTATTNIVAALIVNGTSEPAGIYNSNNLASITSGGSLQVVPPPVAINPNAGPILFSRSGNTLNLAWPTNGGWQLQSNTNLLGTNWVDVSGSTSLTNLSITTTNPVTFYRLMYP
jgi:fibronectin-binding autotransporter adhesin